MMHQKDQKAASQINKLEIAILVLNCKQIIELTTSSKRYKGIQWVAMRPV